MISMGHFPWLCQITRGYHQKHQDNVGKPCFADEMIYRCSMSLNLSKWSPLFLKNKTRFDPLAWQCLLHWISHQQKGDTVQTAKC